ncbi:bifunctional folylpolyglutamate synthase/dihydrofolate synthase [Myroides sp. LJL115]
MTYQQTLQWMFAQLPMYQIQGAVAYKADLSNIYKLCDYLGNPQKDFKTIHIAGTNGKGSTSSMLSSILQQAGYKVGLYTSPHLKDFRERIKISGQEISQDFVVEFIHNNKSFFEQNDLSFFEMTVAMAFAYFKEQQVDVAVIEVGMGGRLDATNIINPLLSIITNIGLDHTAFLGNTLAKVALEKAGIIKENTPVVIGEYTHETKEVFLEVAKQKNAPIYFSQDLYNKELPQSDLKGSYQKNNIRCVCQAMEVLKHDFNISSDAIKQGLLHVVENTHFLGRWQKLGHSPTIIADTAHNAHGLEIVMQQLKEQTYDKLWIVFGVVNDKDLDSILGFLPKEANYLFSKPDNSRAMDPFVLQEKAKQYGLIGEVCDSIPEAYVKAKALAAAEDFIYIGGSTFVVAEIL